MKLLTNKSFVQKIIIAIIFVILFNFAVPMRVQALSLGELGLDLLKELVQLFAAFGDVVMGALNKMMLGTSKMVDSAMLEKNDINLLSGTDANKNPKTASSLYVTNSQLNQAKSDGRVKYVNNELDGLIWAPEAWKIPNFLYCPENIFGNKIAALDVNFINPHQFTGTEYKNSDGSETAGSANKSESSAATLRNVISSWYKAFRNIAIVGLLSVLVYLGIRILIGSTAQDKAKYKETLKDWLVALCLVFIIHFIMSAILMVTEKVTEMLSQTDDGIIVLVTENGKASGKPELSIGEGSNGAFRTNLTGYLRFMAQSDDWGDSVAYTIMYLAIVIYTVMFTFTYFKRFLYMAFFTMIAPLVALTYPIDKAGDGKAQAFNLWFKEYTMNAIIQPVHLLLYTVLVTSAMELAINTPIYAIVALAFLIAAEKFVKRMFGLDRAETTSGLGAFAGGALTMKGVGAVAGLFKNTGNSKGGSSNQSGGDDQEALPGRGRSSVRYNGNPNPDPLDTIGGESGNLRLNDNNTTNNNENRNLNNLNDLSNVNDQNNLLDIEGTTYRQRTSGIVIPASTQQETPPRVSNQTETIPEQSQQSSTKPSKIDRAKNVASVLYNTNKKRIAGAMSVDNMKSKAWKAAKGITKTGLKTATKVGGAVAGATVTSIPAAAAAVTSGDLQTGMSILAGGASMGAGIGGKLGAQAGDRVLNKASEEIDRTKNTIRTAAYTPDELKKRDQAKFDKNFKSSADNYSYLRSQGLSHADAENFLQKESQDFLDAGVDDIKVQYKAKELANKKGYTREGMVARAELAQKVAKDFSKNENAQRAFRKNIMSKNDNIDENKANDLIDDIKKINK